MYQVPCGTCDDFHVGETVRALGKRFEDHTSTDKESAVLEHLKSSGYSLSFEDERVLASEAHFQERKVREALEIYKRSPSHNRDQGYEVAPVLLNLLPTSSAGPLHHQCPRAFPRLRPWIGSI